MAFAQGIDFRSTAAFVTDPADCDSQTGTTANYPHTTAQGVTVGWETVNGTLHAIDVSASNDARVAGIQYQLRAVNTYRIDLPAAGSYDVQAAIGTPATSGTFGASAGLYDGTTLLSQLGVTTGYTVGTLYDATNTLRSSAADWATNQAPATFTFATTIFRVQSGNASINNNWAIPHIHIASVAAATTYTLTGPSTGTVGVASSNFTLTPSAALSGADSITLSDGSAGGTFSPTSLSFASGATAAQNFTYAAASAGTVSISATSATLALTVSGSPISFTASAASTTAYRRTLSALGTRTGSRQAA